MRNRLITLHDGQQFDVDDPEQSAYLASAIALPPSPRCARCGHQMCPDCGTWCDTLIMLDASGKRCAVECLDDAFDVECCCDGMCDVSRLDVAEWRDEIQPLIALAQRHQLPIIGAAGPYIPPPILRARRLTPERIEDGNQAL